MVWLCIVRGDDSTCSDLFDAARKNHVGCLQHAVSRKDEAPANRSWGPPLSANKNPFAINNRNHVGYTRADESGYPGVCEIAAGYGHLQFLQCARESGCPWDEATTFMASRNGHIDCLRYALEHGCPVDGQSLHLGAAAGNHLECMRYAHENGILLSYEHTGLAALFGAPDCLRYAINSGFGRLDDNNILSTAARHGSDTQQAACVKYLLKKGFIADHGTAGLPIIVNTLAEIATENEAAAIVIQRSWLKFLYRPESQWTVLRERKSRFTEMQSAP